MNKPRMLLPDKKKRSAEKSESVEIHFDLRDEEDRALYRFAKNCSDFSELIKALLKRQLEKRRRRSRGRKGFSDRTLREMKYEVERQEEEDVR